MTTITQNITPLSTPPSTNDPATFDTRADTFLGELPDLATEINTWAGQANTVAGEVNQNRIDAEAASSAAISATNAAAWVSGQTYQAGDTVYSPINALSYRANTTTSGTTDPSASADWTVISGNVSTTGTQTLTNKTINAANNTVTVDGTNAVGFKNLPAVGTKTGSYTLAVGDIGKYVQVGSGGSITIPDATFSEGDAISIFNNTTGNITITCSITTAYIAGTDSDKATMTLATRGIATVLFISGTVCVVSGNVA